MTDPKKRLEQLIENWYEEDVYWGGGDSPDGDYIPGRPHEDNYKTLANQILKEFVHKDNLPNETAILDLIDMYIYGSALNTLDPFKRKIACAKAIRELTEGKK